MCVLCILFYGCLLVLFLACRRACQWRCVLWLWVVKMVDGVVLSRVGVVLLDCYVGLCFVLSM